MKDTISEPLGERGDGGAPGARVEDRGRSGVALILVIGMLALMVVLGVTFSIYMRTERVAAGSFKSGVVARQLISVALNRALDAINTDLGNKPYPTWNVLESSNSITIIPDVTNINSMAWIPRAALGSNQTPTPRWIDVPGVDGRVGYLVVNCSGLLDANISGSNGGTRSIGTNVNEIQISVCPDVANVVPLVAGRPYETIQELGATGLVSGALNQPVSNFVCFSCFPADYPGGATNIPLVDLSGDENELMKTNRHAAIIGGLTNSGIASDQAEFVYTNLLDYVDADDVPRDLGSACTEAVPMFYAIRIEPRYTFKADTNCYMIGEMSIKWFYPFVKTSTSSNFWIRYNLSFENKLGGNFPLPSTVSSTVFAADSCLPESYGVAKVSFSLASSAYPTNYGVFVGSTNQLNAKINLEMHANGVNGPIVDATPYPLTSTFNMLLQPFKVPPPTSLTRINTVTNRECVDPRYNWKDSTTYWKYTTNAWVDAGVNAETAKYFARSNIPSDKHTSMFVAHRPLVNVTELTYLLRDGLNPWMTIRLFDCGGTPAIDPVLDFFTLGTNTLMKGFVNPNSGVFDVLTAVLTNMPVDNYPGDPATVPLSALTVALVRDWADTNQNPWRCNFAKLSDIGHATNVFGTQALSGLTPFQQESFFRNTAGLFNTRQQYFKILLFAQAAKIVPLMPDKSVLSDVRAVAEVWRDPLPNAEGIHPCVIRMVHLLNND